MRTAEPFVNSIKLWLFPSVVTVLSVMIWNDVTQIKEDLKLLMAQSNIDKTRIDNLERRVDKLETVTFTTKSTQTAEPIIAHNSSYYIKEEEFDIKKYLKK